MRNQSAMIIRFLS